LDFSASRILLQSGVAEEVALNAIRFSVGRETTAQEILEAVNELADVARDQRGM